MKTTTFVAGIVAMLTCLGVNQAMGQWSSNGNHIYNTNSGNVGIGNNSPVTLLHVQKNMTEPSITVQNLGGSGGATYTMIDNVSGANWKFKATSIGGFKIRDHANLMDVIVIEPNSFANALYINSANSIGIGTSAPHTSALVDMTSTTKGFLPPRMTQSQIQGIPGAANGLLVFCTTDNKYYVYIATLNAWKEVAFGTGTLSPLNICGSPMTKTHTAGIVAPVDKTVTYGTVLTDLTGTEKCWITQNLGADNQATSATDNTEPSAGWYWQFNRQQGYKHDGVTRTPGTAWISAINENLHWQTENDPCRLLLGSEWRLPTNSEWNNADINGGWDDYSETFASVLKLHTAGYLRADNGNLQNRGVNGYFWSSIQSATTQGQALFIYSSSCNVGNASKTYAKTIRCLRD